MDDKTMLAILNSLDQMGRSLIELLSLQSKINAQLEALLTQRGRETWNKFA